MSFIREHVVKPLTRSRGWRKVRKAHIKKHPYCEVCGSKKGVEVHHVEDFSEHPELELDPNNLISLCRKRRCHLLFGHLNNFKSINPKVRDDAETWSAKIKNRR